MDWIYAGQLQLWIWPWWKHRWFPLSSLMSFRSLLLVLLSIQIVAEITQKALSSARPSFYQCESLSNTSFLPNQKCLYLAYQSHSVWWVFSLFRTISLGESARNNTSLLIQNDCWMVGILQRNPTCKPVVWVYYKFSRFTRVAEVANNEFAKILKNKNEWLRNPTWPVSLMDTMILSIICTFWIVLLVIGRKYFKLERGLSIR